VKRPSRPPADSAGSPPGGLRAGELRRAAAGFLGLALLAVAVVLWLSATGEQAQLWMSSCLRVGSVLCLLWLAWPQLSRLHPWLILGGLAILVAVLVLARQPRILLIGLAILIVLARLRPRAR
jgi:hypothetical protein